VVVERRLLNGGMTTLITNAAKKWLQIEDYDQIRDFAEILDLDNRYIGIRENHTDQIDLDKNSDLAFFVHFNFDLHSDSVFVVQSVISTPTQNTLSISADRCHLKSSKQRVGVKRIQSVLLNLSKSKQLLT
jgi:hypothetical protein